MKSHGKCLPSRWNAKRVNSKVKISEFAVKQFTNSIFDFLILDDVNPDFYSHQHVYIIRVYIGVMNFLATTSRRQMLSAIASFLEWRTHRFDYRHRMSPFALLIEKVSPSLLTLLSLSLSLHIYLYTYFSHVKTVLVYSSKTISHTDDKNK